MRGTEMSRREIVAMVLCYLIVIVPIIAIIAITAKEWMK